MREKHRNYITKLGGLSVLLLVLSLAAYLTLLKPWFNLVFPFVILYFFLINLAQHYNLLKAARKNQRVFQTNYMMWMSGKFFLNLGFVVVFVLLSTRLQTLNFVLFFMLCYVVFTVYEVVALTKALKSLDTDN